jgi:hypothetical protein
MRKNLQTFCLSYFVEVCCPHFVQYLHLMCEIEGIQLFSFVCLPVNTFRSVRWTALRRARQDCIVKDTTNAYVILVEKYSGEVPRF